jgi:hypothetical protein
MRDTQHNDTGHYCQTQHNVMLSVALIVLMPSVVRLSVVAP